MEPQIYILPVGEGDQQTEYMIDRAVLIDGKCIFGILNLQSFDLMFGEFLGDISEDMEENRGRIYQDFMNGCRHITFVDGYLADDLYEMWDEMM